MVANALVRGIGDDVQVDTFVITPPIEPPLEVLHHVTQGINNL
jgi:hypothetical protein